MPSLDEPPVTSRASAAESAPAPRWGLARHGLLNDNVRLFLAAIVAILAQFLIDLPERDRVIAAWDVGAALYLALTWWAMLSAGAWSARRWLAVQDAPRSRLFAMLFGPQANLGLAIVVSLIGVGSALTLIGQDTGGDENIRRSLHALGVILAWLVLNTAFTLYYVYLYYRGGGAGLRFPGAAAPGSPDDAEPDQLDFAYFAFTLATSFATSDVDITDRAVRRTALGHSVLAFGYNTAILSIAVGFLTGF